MVASVQTHTTQEENKKVFSHSDPFKYLHTWDFIVMFLAIIVRVLWVMNQKSEELAIEGKSFNFKTYWDSRHLLRLSLHVLCCILVLLTFPEIMIEVVQKRYFEEITYWTAWASGVVGLLGDNFIKFGEKLAKGYFKKNGIEV